MPSTPCLFIDNGAVGTDTNTMNVVVGGTLSSQKNDFSTGDPNNFNDIFISNNVATTTLNLSRNGASGTTATDVLKNANLNGPATAVLENGTINLVNTLPIVPSSASCTLAAALDGARASGDVQIASAAPRQQAQPAAAQPEQIAQAGFSADREFANSLDKSRRFS